jgi:nucleoside-diphosphate-sugar epimerase
VSADAAAARRRVIREDAERIAAAPLPWERLAGRTVLVAGAAGFLPAYLVETILHLNDTRLARPAQVVGLVRDEGRARLRFADHLGRADLRLLAHDVRRPLPWEGEAHLVVHAASPASPRHYGVDPAGTIAANCVGAYHLLELARERRAEGFLFFSSGEVYGHVEGGDGVLAEGRTGAVDPADPASCYAEGKRAGETLCACWHRQHGVPAVIVRPFHTYGPGMAPDDGRVFADFVADVVARRDIVLRSDGTARRSFCYLADATAGFFTALLRGAPGEAYNVGDPGGEMSVGELAELLVRLFPERGLRVARRPGDHPAGYVPSRHARTVPDIVKIRALGWSPATGVAAGFARTVRSYGE